MVISLVLVLLLAVAAAGGLVPAVRAARTPAIVALRSDSVPDGLRLAVPFAVTVGLAASVFFVMAAASSTSAQQNEWRDPSPHKSSLVSVDAGVELGVLDWGGSGRALLLMHGGGDSAHVCDAMAPVLAKRYPAAVVRT
jgi:hypothetical protein